MKQLVALTLLVCVRVAFADANAESRAIATTGAFFALSVPDLDASAKWYEDKLGLKITMKPPREGQVEFAVLEGGGLIVELIRNDAALSLDKLQPPVDDAFKIHGYFKAGVLVKDFDAALATLKARGVDIAHGPYPSREGRRANVIIRDNAGNLIQFFGPAPG